MPLTPIAPLWQPVLTVELEFTIHTRQANKMRWAAYAAGVLPRAQEGFFATGEIPGGMRTPHAIEIEILERITDVMAAELLSMECLHTGCTFGTGTCPRFCATTIDAFESWMVA